MPTMDMVKAFLIRLDLAREYTFGKILIIGSKPPYQVKGFWLFHPHMVTDLAIERCKESHEITEVDLSVEDQKTRVTQMIKSEDPFEDEEIVHEFCFM
ncbi:elongation factor 1-gamma-like protein [Tanacetum coccineum]